MNRTVAWRTLGTILIAAAGIIIGFAYLTRASAESCAVANQSSIAAGQPAACSTNPPAAVFITAAALGLAGLLILVNARTRN
jgi:hypothetical protein